MFCIRFYFIIYMKKILALLSFVIIGFTGFAQTTPASPAFFANTEHNFGKIKKDKPVTKTFTLTNKGKKPLLIENATAECGCTTPEYSKAAILKNKTSTIKVTFNAATIGVFTKRVTVKFVNIAEPVILTIKGEVLAK